MAWIELHQGLAQHHKLRRLKRSLGVGVAQAIGHMALLWTWALDATPDGDLSRFDAIDIAEQAEWEGDPVEFVEALVSAGLLDREDGRLVIHDWMDYAGRLVEKRRTDAERKRMSRGRPTDIYGTALVTVPNRTVPKENMSAVADGCVPFGEGEPTATLEADEQEHVGDTIGATGLRPAPKPRNTYSEEFTAFWEAYPGPRRVDKADCAKKLRAILSSGVSVEDLMAGLAAWKHSDDWRKDGGQFVCAPLVWLNKRRWEDAPGSVPAGLSMVPDLPPLKPIPPEIADAPWLGVWLEKGGKGVGYASVMNLASAVGVDAQRAFELWHTEGLRAAGDWVWKNRQTN